jgi:hypothetical protein
MKTILFAGLFLFFISCKKENPVNTPSSLPGNPNNKVESDIAVSEAILHISSTGNNTIFVRKLIAPGDTLFTIQGSITDGKHFKDISVQWGNITVSGTYDFGQQLDSGKYITIEYSDVVPLGDGYFYLAFNELDAGELIIDSISDKHIQGSFKARCRGQNGIAEITNGSFSGDFE